MTDFSAIIQTVADHALASGLFETVNQHEPKNAPGNGLNAAIWIDYIGPANNQSGLNKTTGLLVVTNRVYSSMFQTPYDDIDPNLLSAVNTLMVAYSGDFQFGAKVKNVDLLGMSGRKLEAQAGYVPIDNKVMRVMEINIPLIINDLWNQVA